ncbi:MAG: hypothetical protein FJ221_07775 [Lentisphaerae bacterium]|nr:hypothetical protein [Lentisphaerota bacterium]
MNKTIVIAGLAAAGALGWAAASRATNGMDLEGYGPIAQGQGGASLASDNGTAAVINNPATLSLMPDGGRRVDVAFGLLGPDVEASVPGMPVAHSSGDAYFMPAFGYAKRSGDFTYGIGVFGQGGMGTRYAASSFLALNSGEPVMSEVSVGRLIAPVSYNVLDNLALAGTLDFLWAGMDLRMAMTAPQAMGMLSGMPTLAMPALGPGNYLRVDFADGSQFTGDAAGYGVSGKFGLLYQITPKIRVGAMYHAEPDLGDLKSEDATLSFGDMATGTRMGAVEGEVRVHDFHWPAMYGGGLAVDATDRLTLSVDVKRILWEDVMRSMDMTFTADGGGSVSFSLPQGWEDQTVWCVGAALKATDALIVRAGYNFGENPVPEANVNPLFPAIVEHHITAGASYALDDQNSVHLSVVYVPETDVTAASGVTSTHSQFNAQVMYSYTF